MSWLPTNSRVPTVAGSAGQASDPGSSNHSFQLRVWMGKGPHLVGTKGIPE